MKPGGAAASQAYTRITRSVQETPLNQQ